MSTSITHALRQIKDELDAHITTEDIGDACLAWGPGVCRIVRALADSWRAARFAVVHKT